MNDYPVTELNRVRRLPKRGGYDAPGIHAILDAGFICHVGFTIDGRAVVLPTGYARDGDSLILHGSAASRMLRSLSAGIKACVTVTHVDGFVLARSAFHHSINYRSAVLFGTARLIEDASEKTRALQVFMEHLTPGRWDETRTPSANELKATAVLRFFIEEASSKVRTGPPVDDEEDHQLDVWAGVIPLLTVSGQPEPATDLREGIQPGAAIDRTASRWSRGSRDRLRDEL